MSETTPSSIEIPNPPRLPPPWDRLLPLATKVLIWGLLFGVVYLLQSFFLLLFLTFVFAYLQASVVTRLLPYSRRRTLLVTLIGLLFLSVIIALSLFLAPRVYQQAAGFAGQFTEYAQRIDQELLRLSKHYPVLQEAVPELYDLQALQGENSDMPPKSWNLSVSPSAALFEALLGLGESTVGEELDEQQKIKRLLDHLANLGRQAVAIASTFFLALLFSFLIVLDLPKLSASVRDLANTKLDFIYAEAADNIRDFGLVLGQALEAQFFIACVNTLLTALGMYALGMGAQIAFLSTIVFLCSFIPVIGVFISSVPICLVALNSGGLQLVILAIFLIIVIHMIEGYVLNPRIYGARMHINPVIVLIILTVGGKLFHIWGLILGVPVCTYIFGHAIRYKFSGKDPKIY